MGAISPSVCTVQTEESIRYMACMHTPIQQQHHTAQCLELTSTLFTPP